MAEKQASAKVVPSFLSQFDNLNALTKSHEQTPLLSFLD